MGLDYTEPEESTPQKPQCDKCHNELKANNTFSCDDGKTVCGSCREQYLIHTRKFFN